MTKRRFAKDDDGNTIHAGYAAADAAHQGTAGEATSLVGPFTDRCRAIEIWASGDIRYQTGGADVEAAGTSHFLAAGERLVRSLLPRSGADYDTHIAIMRAGNDDSVVEISEIM